MDHALSLLCVALLGSVIPVVLKFGRAEHRWVLAIIVVDSVARTVLHVTLGDAYSNGALPLVAQIIYGLLVVAVTFRVANPWAPLPALFIAIDFGAQTLYLNLNRPFDAAYYRISNVCSLMMIVLLMLSALQERRRLLVNAKSHSGDEQAEPPQRSVQVRSYVSANSA